MYFLVGTCGVLQIITTQQLFISRKCKLIISFNKLILLEDYKVWWRKIQIKRFDVNFLTWKLTVSWKLASLTDFRHLLECVLNFAILYSLFSFTFLSKWISLILVKYYYSLQNFINDFSYFDPILLFASKLWK